MGDQDEGVTFAELGLSYNVHPSTTLVYNTTAGHLSLPETLHSIFPKSEDLLALEPEDLAGVLLEVVPGVIQNGRFAISHLVDPLFPPTIGATYPYGIHRAVELAIAEAVSWLVSQGLLVIDPSQQIGRWYALTRRAATLRNRADLEAYRKGRMLPVELLPPTVAEKVWPQFLRGDHEIAILQAFKQVEVAVRKAANGKGARYPDDLVGTTLMRKAFHPDSGPLTDTSLVVSEREAEMHLFSGAIGHGRNPPSHRDTEPTPQEAARLIVFASHLLSIVERRSS